MNRFDKAFEHVIGIEGIYSDDPDDAGGPTKYGISLYKFYRPVIDRNAEKSKIRDLTLEEAKEIYRKYFWNDTLPDGVAEIVFDIGVNIGVRFANTCLQRALNRVGYNLVIDGIVGPKTRRAAHDAPRNLLLVWFTIHALKYYDWAAKKGNNRKYLDGWHKRLLIALTKYTR